MFGLNLDSYLARIGYSGSTTATLETLRALCALHPEAIPFENLDVLLKRPIRLDIESLSAKLVHERRGGYCFEQNTLFQAALQALGFSVRAIAARVQWRHPEGALNPRSHMVLLVSLPEGDLIADAGFGGLTLTAPLRMEAGAAQTTSHGTYRLVPVGEELQLQARMAEGWSAVYQMSMQEQASSDWEVVNWYTSTHPASRFTRQLMAARPLGERRLALLDNVLRIHRPDGTSERRVLATAEELALVMRDDFGVTLPEEGARLLCDLMRELSSAACEAP